MAFVELLIEIRHDYFTYLRNLTPIILFFSIGLFGLTKIKLFTFNIYNWDITLLTFGSLFIAFSTLLLNIYDFLKASMKSIEVLKEHESDKKEKGERVTFKEAWNILKNSKFLWQAIFFYIVCLVSTAGIFLVAIFNAVSFYETSFK